MLVIIGGRSGVGKTTIARELARELGAVYLRIDSIEQAIRDSNVVRASIDDAGYRAAYAIAEDNLKIGRTVVADCVNPLPITRDAWHAAAARASVRAIDVEIVCSDRDEQRRRVETRTADIAGHTLPTWQEVVNRDYVEWDATIVIDTARRSVADSVAVLKAALR
jgi:predicted kinase